MSDWGGARTPANPAMVSGPGAMSARTDGGVMNPNSPSYGEGAALESISSSAPLAGASGASGSASGGGGADPMAGMVGLDAPTQAPGEPVTAGAALGAGPGPDVLGLPMDPAAEKRADARSLDPALMNALLAEATSERATPSFKRRVREVFANS